MNQFKGLYKFCPKPRRQATQEDTQNLLNYLKTKKYSFQQGNIVYYKDRWNRLRKFDNSDSKAPKGTIRLRPLEGMYRWWKNKTPDVQNALTPILISIIVGIIIYNSSNFVIEREETMMDNGRVPEYVNKEVFKKWKQNRKQEEQ